MLRIFHQPVEAFMTTHIIKIIVWGYWVLVTSINFCATSLASTVGATLNDGVSSVFCTRFYRKNHGSTAKNNTFMLCSLCFKLCEDYADISTVFINLYVHNRWMIDFTSYTYILFSLICFQVIRFLYFILSN